MLNSTGKRNWILLIHQLPAKPTNLRVRIWRKLQQLGAIAIKNSIYVLPFDDKTYEDFQWIKQEIQSTGGEASVFQASAVEDTTDEEIVAAFQKTRNDEYASVTADLDGLSGAMREQRRGGHFSTERIRNYEAELGKLLKELDRIISSDFFEASGRSTALSAYEHCRKVLNDAGNHIEGLTKSDSFNDASVNLEQYQGRRWVTRQHLFIDRLATIWLIKRFIDKRPRLYFVADGETVDGGIGFDMYGAEFTHEGEDCTFETMMKRFRLSEDAGLRTLAEIIHDIDLKDNKFNRLEAAGLGIIIQGLADFLKDDRKLILQCNPIFDGLYELFKRDSRQLIKPRSEKKQSRRESKSAKQSRRK